MGFSIRMNLIEQAGNRENFASNIKPAFSEMMETILEFLNMWIVTFTDHPLHYCENFSMYRMNLGCSIHLLQRHQTDGFSSYDDQICWMTA